MKTPLLLVAVMGALALAIPSVSHADPSSSPQSSEKDAAYLKKLDARVSPIVAALSVSPEKSATVHRLIVAQYRTLNTWHDVNDARLASLTKVSGGVNADEADKAKAELSAIQASLRGIHDRFLAALAEHLTSEQIEKVKDGMTAGKVQFTYQGYLQQIPTLTEEQKALVLGLLKDAREEAMDAGSMEEKSAIFNRYKGRINNALSKQGVEQRTTHKK